MQRPYLPPSVRYLQPQRVLPGVALDHASLVYDLVEALRPALLVDLGTGPGVAFAVACQSLRDHDVGGSAYAVDSWADDDGKAEDDPTRWASLNGFLRAQYRGVSYLLKTTPAEALQHFADASLGLLRIDAARCEGELGALLGAWLPRLAPGGVLLCAGIEDPARPDAANAWSSTMQGREVSVFHHGKGLGLYRKPGGTRPAHDAELLELIDARDSELERFYAHADQHHALRVALADQRLTMQRKQ